MQCGQCNLALLPGVRFALDACFVCVCVLLPHVHERSQIDNVAYVLLHRALVKPQLGLNQPHKR